MNNAEILIEINTIFQNVFKNPKLQVNLNSSAQDVDEWDSLNNIQIIIAVEKYFKIRFKASEIKSWNNVGEMCEAILRYLNAK